MAREVASMLTKHIDSVVAVPAERTSSGLSSPTSPMSVRFSSPTSPNSPMSLGSPISDHTTSPDQPQERQEQLMFKPL
eukprot:UN5150